MLTQYWSVTYLSKLDLKNCIENQPKILEMTKKGTLLFYQIEP